MSNTETDWLALREPHDHAARCADLAAAFARVLNAEASIIDLACGTGSNVRYLGAKLEAKHRWLCVDCSPEMLALATAMMPHADLEFAQCDLSRDLSTLPVEAGAAVTMSAFLDMTSAAWVDQLVALCHGVTLLAALTFDGRIAWEPAEADDAAILRQVLIHRRADHGFGPALGPDAVPYLAEQLGGGTHHIMLAASDWLLGPGDRTLMQAMLAGIARRVRCMSSTIAIDRWLEIRKRQLDAGELRLVVGHIDLLALPTS